MYMEMCSSSFVYIVIVLLYCEENAQHLCTSFTHHFVKPFDQRDSRGVVQTPTGPWYLLFKAGLLRACR